VFGNPFRPTPAVALNRRTRVRGPARLSPGKHEIRICTARKGAAGLPVAARRGRCAADG
jgi:hypothetical protein